MKQSTYEYWVRIIEDQGKSGCGVKAYCTEHGISTKSFYAARRKSTPKNQM